MSTSFKTTESNVAMPWSTPVVQDFIARKVLYVPISDSSVTSIPIYEVDEQLVDLLVINHPRIKPVSTLTSKYKDSYEGYSKVRFEVYQKLLKMLEILPSHIGIAYTQGLRPLAKQKEYFDNKFKEILQSIPDKEKAYQETTKHISPFIDNIPVHATGAAIDMSLFTITDTNKTLMDMGEFGVTAGHNSQQETFSNNTTSLQRNNRLVLLNAASKAGLVNYGYEWWHYSYGDKAWASVNQKNNALYGLAVSKDSSILSIDKKTYLNTIL